MSQSVPGFPRLTIEQDKLGGQPCIRGHRFGAEQLLEMLADGMTYEEIRADYAFIELEDVQEVLRYAAAIARREFYLPTSA